MRKTLKRNLAYDDRNHLYYVSLYYDGENGRRVRRTRTYQTMEQAEQVIADYRRAQLLGGKSAPRDVSMEDWLRYWMREIITPNCAETTRHGYENILYTHMIPTLGKVYVQELTAMRVQQYYGELRKKGLANNTIRKHHVLLHAALGAAVRQGIVRDNVADLVTPPAHEAPRHRFYDSSQLRKLFCASEGSQLEIAVKLAGCLGLRRSEICGLKWRNVDLERGVLTICEVRTAVSGRALEKAPKSYASERRLAFRGSEDLEALLHRLHREWEQRRKENAAYNPEGYVAVNKAGKPYQPDILCRRIAQFIAEQGLPPISLHGLRHSFASVANSQNVPMFSISKALGHSSTSVTSAVYMHLLTMRWQMLYRRWRAPSQGRSRERQGKRNGSAGRANSTESSACKAFPL